MSKSNIQKEILPRLGEEFSGPEYVRSLGGNVFNGGQLVEEALQHDIIERTGNRKFRYRRQPLILKSIDRS